MSELAPELGRREFVRWIWRQLTSMRTALLLLMLLAIAAVPGSFWPQRSVDARKVEQYFIDHPDLAPVLDKIGVFNVFTSPWFSAVYILLMISLVGCIIPRALVYARSWRARPPKAPKNLLRLPDAAEFETDAEPAEVAAAARRMLGRQRVDIVDDDSGDGPVSEVRAEKGQLRELGNLIFHVSIVVVLVGVAVGALYSYRGAAIVVQGNSFSNTLTQYDEFGSGALFDVNDLPPFSLDLERMQVRFRTEGDQRGAPEMFRATGTLETASGDRPFDIEVNHPAHIGDTGVFLVGQGYAPVIKVTDPSGRVVFDDAVPFLPADPTYTSNGVIKVPDARPEQLGFQGFFLPTAVRVGEEEASVSAFPGAANPLLGLFVYHGDLGLDDGKPQSVYLLDKTNLSQYKTEDGGNYRVSLSPGQEQVLPDGSTIAFTDLKLFARFQISETPLLRVPLIGTSLGLLGLMLSLFIRPRRTWIRARRQGSRTVVHVAALDRVQRDDAGNDLTEFVERLRAELGDLPSGSDEGTA